LIAAFSDPPRGSAGDEPRRGEAVPSPITNGSPPDTLQVLRELQEENARLRALSEVRWFQHHPLPTLIIEPRTQLILDVNDAAVRQFRYDRDQFLQLRFDTLRMSRGVLRRRELRQQLLAALGNPVASFLRKDGSSFEGEVFTQDVPFLGLAAQVVQVLDVSGRLDTESNIRDHERRYKWLLENVSECVWRFDQEIPVPVSLSEDEQIERMYQHAYLAEANQSMAAASGYHGPDAMLGLRLDMLVPRANPSNVEFLRKFIRNGYRLIDEESVEVDARGRTRWFLSRLVGEVEAGRFVRAWGSSTDVTERKLAELRGRQYERLWRDALESIHLLALFVDEQGKITYVNPHFTTVTGWGMNEVIGRNWFTDLCQEKSEDFNRDRSRVLEDEIDTHSVCEIIAKDGSPRQVRWNNTLLRDGQGRPLGKFRIGEDITEQLRTGAALHESEERYRRLVEGLPLGIYRSSPEGQLDFCNPAAARLFGVPFPEQVSSVDLETYYFGIGYSRSDFKARMEAEGELLGLEAQWNPKPGVSMWVREHARAVRDSRGKVRYYEGTLEDITKQKQAEQELREREEQNRVLVQLAPVGTFMTRRGLVVSANQALADLLGYDDPEQVLGKHLLELLHPSEREIVQTEYLSPPMTVGVMPVHDRRMLRKDGAAVLVEVHVARVQVQNDRGSVIVVRDVTAERQADQERRRWQQRMLEMQKLDSLGLLAGGLAHDFNNQLTVILGHLDLVRDALPNQSSLEAVLEPADQAAKHARMLCQQMLSFAGRGKIDVGQVHLSKTVHDVTALLKVASSKRADLDLNLDDHLPPIQAEEAQVRQVLLNLVSNAAEAVVPGPTRGKITIATGVTTIDESYQNPEVTLELPRGEYVYLEVTDTGIGMDVNTRRRIFEPFFTTKPTGRGLGLAAVLGIVRSHGGAIEVNSRLRHGTTFRVFFPLRWPAVPPTSKEIRRRDGTSVSGPRSVLIVDDEPALRTLAGRVLSTNGWRVLEAEDGTSAVDLAREHGRTLDAVVIDLALPGVDGVETLRQLWDVNPNLQAIAMSSHGTMEIERRFAGFPFLGLLPKPFSPNSLVEALDQVQPGGPKKTENKPIAGPVQAN